MKVGQNITLGAKIKVMIADELTQFMGILVCLSACISPLLSLMIISLTLFCWATGFLFLNNDMLSFSCKFSSPSPFTVQSLRTNVSRHKNFNFHLS